MGKKKGGLPYDNRGGVVAIQRRLLTSPAYLALRAPEKALLHLMQVHWRHDKPIAFGVREAMRLIPCSDKVAMRSFKTLQDAGFIEMVDESIFCSRTQSKTRTWRLTWRPWNFKEPTNDWEKSDAD